MYEMMQSIGGYKTMTSGNPVVTPTQTGLGGFEYGEGLEQSSVKTCDRAAMLVIGVICAVGLALVCMIQLVYSASVAAQLFVALPAVLVSLLPLLLLKKCVTHPVRTHAARD